MSIDSIHSPSAESSYFLVEEEEIHSLKSPEEQLKNLLVEGGSKESAVSLFKQFFGENLVSRAIPQIFFDSLPKFLEKADSIYLLIKIGNSVTLDDLDECIQELKSGNHTKLILNAMAKNNRAISYSRLWWAGNARNLSPSDTKVLLDLFRNPLQELDLLSATGLQEVKGASLFINRKFGLQYITYSSQIHQIAEDQSAANKRYFDLAHREPMAKLIAYAEPSTVTKGMIIPCIDEKNNKIAYYELSEHIHKKGLHGYFFTPIQSKENLPAKLVFRGTDDIESIQRDFDPSGIGKTTYDQHASEIVEMTNTYLLKTKHPKLEIIGHSLGAVDAQRTMIELLRPSLSHRFEEISLFGFCAPKLDQATASMTDSYLNELSKKNTEPKLQIVYANHEKDVLTRVSDVHLSGSFDHHIPTRCFYVKSDSNIHNLSLHHTHPFFNLGHFDKIDNRTWEFHDFLSNKDLEIQILKCKTHLQELEKHKNEIAQQENCLYGYLLNLKGYFVTVESSEDVQKTIEQVENRLGRLLKDKEKLENNTSTLYFNWSIDDAVNSFMRILSSDTVRNGLKYYMSFLGEKGS